MKFHDELNQKLFNGEELKPEVKDKLNEIANAFIEFIEVPDEAIADIVLTGSMMSYNYTKFSDIDLHLIVDFEKVHEDCPIVEGYLLSKKSEFNKNHDIFIYGIPVEVYAEDINNNNVHNGLYSLKQDKWLDYPHKIEPTDNDAAVEAKYNEFKDLAEIIDDSEEASALIKKIREMRKSGLEEGGEFSTENLTFKKLRDNGIIGKLMEIKKKEIDKQLSLESYNEANKYSTEEYRAMALNLAKKVAKNAPKAAKQATATFKVYVGPYDYSILLPYNFTDKECRDAEEYARLMGIPYNMTNISALVGNNPKYSVDKEAVIIYPSGKVSDLDGNTIKLESTQKNEDSYVESIKESENIIAKINKLIDNVNKTILDTIKNKKEAKLYTLKQNKNKDGQTVLKLYRGDREFMTSKLVKDSLLGDDIIGHLNSIKSRKYESIKEGNIEDIVNSLIDKYGKEKLQKGLQTPYQKDYIWGLLYREKGLDLTAILDCLKSKLNESIKEEIDKQLSLESYDDKYKHLDRFLNTLPKNRIKYIGVELKDKDGNFEKGLITISYEEPKRDNPIIFYNFHIDCVKNDICQDKAYASLIIDTIKDSIEEYANRHGLEIIKTTSYSSTNESIKEGFFKKELSPLPKKDAKYKIGDKVKVGKEFGEVIAVKHMKMSDTSTYQIKLENGKTVWRYEEELNESVDLQKIFANHPYWTTGEAKEISKDLDELPKGTKIEHRVDNSWHECIEYYVKTDINKTFNDTKANWSYIYIVDGEEVRRKPMTSFDVALDIKEYNNSADGFIVNEPQNTDFEENMDMKEEFIIRKQSEFDGATEEEVGQADSELNAEEAGKEELKQMIADKKIAHPLIKIYKRDAETGNDTFVKDIKPIDLEENQVEESVDHLTDKIDYVNSQLRELIQSIACPIEEPVLAESHELAVKLLAQIDEALGE